MTSFLTQSCWVRECVKHVLIVIDCHNCFFFSLLPYLCVCVCWLNCIPFTQNYPLWVSMPLYFRYTLFLFFFLSPIYQSLTFFSLVAIDMCSHWSLYQLRQSSRPNLCVCVCMCIMGFKCIHYIHDFTMPLFWLVCIETPQNMCVRVFPMLQVLSSPLRTCGKNESIRWDVSRKKIGRIKS